MADVNIIKIEGKPLEKLIETVSAGIGTLYKPRAIRKEAEAKSYEIEIIANANAKASIIKSDSLDEIAERVKKRLFHQEINRQVNLDNIIDNSTKYLNQEVSEIPVNEDWRTRFFNKAQDITSEELQDVWGKILANEINKPGSFSVRTLDILFNLSKNEAESFKKIVCLAFDPLYILKLGSDNLEKYGLTYGDLLILKNIGLLYNDNDLHVRLANDGLVHYNNKEGVKINFGEKEFFISALKNQNYHFPFFH